VLHGILAAAPAFLASLVEFVEALTIVLAVGVAAGWRASLAGAAAGILLLLVLVGVFGPSLARVPERPLQLAIGTLLLLFGIRWLRTACLRAAGVLALRNEETAFARTLAETQQNTESGGFPWAAATTSFNGVALEGLEVVFIVLALGSAAHAFPPAIAGAAAAFGLVLIVGIMVHQPLRRVPENAMKLVVGVMLSAFGTLWLGEALGVAWTGGDIALIGLVGGYVVVALLAIRMARGSLAAL